MRTNGGRFPGSRDFAALAAVVARISDYVRAGAEWVILALRAPFDWAGLDLFVREVMPAFAD